jgi:hypothetical protein
VVLTSFSICSRDRRLGKRIECSQYYDQHKLGSFPYAASSKSLSSASKFEKSALLASAQPEASNVHVSPNHGVVPSQKLGWTEGAFATPLETGRLPGRYDCLNDHTAGAVVWDPAKSRIQDRKKMDSFALCIFGNSRIAETSAPRAAQLSRGTSYTSVQRRFFPKDKRPDLGMSVLVASYYSGMRPLPVTTASRNTFGHGPVAGL